MSAILPTTFIKNLILMFYYLSVWKDFQEGGRGKHANRYGTGSRVSDFGRVRSAQRPVCQTRRLTQFLGVLTLVFIVALFLQSTTPSQQNREFTSHGHLI